MTRKIITIDQIKGYETLNADTLDGHHWADIASTIATALSAFPAMSLTATPYIITETINGAVSDTTNLGNAMKLTFGTGQTVYVPYSSSANGLTYCVCTCTCTCTCQCTCTCTCTCTGPCCGEAGW